jgi:hypothetical protein
MAPLKPQRSGQAWSGLELQAIWATLCISNRISKVKMGKMPCCKIPKVPPAGTERTLRQSLLALKSHQRIEIENNYNQEERRMRTEIDRTPSQTCKTIPSYKVTNHTEDLTPCQSKSSNNPLRQEISALLEARRALSRCFRTWMRWTLPVNIKIIWSNNFRRTCHILRESSTTRFS